MDLSVDTAAPIRLRSQNGGRFISRGRGRHAVRTLSSWELIFVLEGTLSIFVGQENFDVGPGVSLLLPAGVRHGGGRPYPQRLSFFWGHFHPAAPEDFEQLRCAPRCFPAARPARLAEYWTLFLAHQQESPEDDAGRDLWMQQLLHEALLGKTAVPAEADLPLLLRRLRQMLMLRFREPLSTSFLAAQLQCHPDYLGRLHRAYFGNSITDALNGFRLRHAAGLLRDSPLTIAQIAAETGFNDPAYFRRLFFRAHAMSPRTFRKLLAAGHVNTE